MSETISVIVPIYNVEKYLQACVDSIVNQTYKELEIILVDDGATDSSPEICDDNAKRDSRIKVIHKPNGGLSDARNAGIKYATGQWIFFIDSDDTMNLNTLELLYSAAIKNACTMTWCGIAETDEEGRFLEGVITDSLDYEPVIYTKQEAEGQMYTVSGMQRSLVAWNKLYHRSLFDGDDGLILYPVGKIYEDGYTTYRLIYNSDRIAYVPIQLYYYRQRNGSIMKNNSKVTYEPALEAGLERMEFYTRHNEKTLYLAELNLTIYSAIRFYERNKAVEDKKKLREYFKRLYYDYFLKEKWPFAKKVRMKAFLMGYPFYKLISSFEGIYNKLRG